MGKVILFDIDKVIFDREKFVENFFKILNSDYDLSLDDVEEIKRLYIAIKEEFGFFNTQGFLKKIYIQFSKLENKLDFYFKSENMHDFLFDDSKVIYSLKSFRIGIFSKGDSVFQKQKIVTFRDVIENSLIYIYHDKIKKLPEVLDKLSDFKIYLVDDSIEVLKSSKEVEKNVKTILVDRENKFSNHNKVDFKLSTLFDIISILNEKTT